MLFVYFHDESEATDLRFADLNTISKVADRWLVIFCPSKIKNMPVSLKKGGTVINEVIAYTNFGVIITKNQEVADIFSPKLAKVLIS